MRKPLELHDSVTVYRTCDWCFRGVADGGTPTGQERPIMGLPEQTTPVMLCQECTSNPNILAALDAMR